MCSRQAATRLHGHKLSARTWAKPGIFLCRFRQISLLAGSFARQSERTLQRDSAGSEGPTARFHHRFNKTFAKWFQWNYTGHRVPNTRSNTWRKTEDCSEHGLIKKARILCAKFFDSSFGDSPFIRKGFPQACCCTVDLSVPLPKCQLSEPHSEFRFMGTCSLTTS